MILWIITLDNGFERSQILSGDLLPEVTRGDLSVSPFNIDEFVIKRDLENVVAQ